MGFRGLRQGATWILGVGFGIRNKGLGGWGGGIGVWNLEFMFEVVFSVLGLGLTTMRTCPERESSYVCEVLSPLRQG